MQLLSNYTIHKEAYQMISLFITLTIVSCKKEVKTENLSVSFNTSMQQQFHKDITIAISYLDSIKQNPNNAETNFKEAKKYFKKLEPVLSFLDVENYSFLNQPNILKVEEEDFTDIKIKSPSGYQVLEEEIFVNQVDTVSVVKHANLVTNRLKLIQENTSFNHLKTYHFLWILRKAITRVALTGITGFDSPVLENSLEDSKVVYQSLKEYLALMSLTVIIL